MWKITRLLEAHVNQLDSQFNQVEDILADMASEILRDSATLPVRGMWLWVLMEQVERTQDKKLLELYSIEIAACLSHLTSEWCNPAVNLWNKEPNEVHTSNLGIVFGALTKAKQIMGRNFLQQTLTSIRDYVFQNNLSGGTLVRCAGKPEVGTDLLVTVIPFGLFSPEDLVVVGAVKVLEDSLEEMRETVLDEQGSEYAAKGSEYAAKRSEYAAKGSEYAAQESEYAAGVAWLAWYFTEKGELPKARYYLQLAEGYLANSLQDAQESQQPAQHTQLAQLAQHAQPAKELVSIVHHYIDQILEINDSIQILHAPFGNDNPYENLKIERYPKEPIVDEEVRVCAQIWPSRQGVQVWVNVQTNARNFKTECLPRLDGSDQVWEGSLGTFTFQESASYHFTVCQNGLEITRSEVYSFSPLIENSIIEVELLESIGETMWLRGTDRLGLEPVFIGIFKELTGPRIQVRSTPPDGLQNAGLPKNFNQGRIELLGNSWTCQIEQHFQITIYDSAGQAIIRSCPDLPTLAWWTAGNGNIEKIQWNFYTPDDEYFYGFGERFNRLEQRGETLDTYVYNQYRDQGTRTYIPVPFYISSKGYGLFLDSSNYSVFDLAHKSPNLLSISGDICNDQELSFYVFLGNPKEVCQHFTAVTGKPKLPPTWAFGPWMSSNNWDRDSVVREQVEKTNLYQIPSTVLVIEQWSDETTFYVFNDAEYLLKSGDECHSYEEFSFPTWGRWPDPRGLFDYLHDNGLRVILWQIPIQKYLNRQTHAQKDEDERFMIEAGHVVSQADGSPFRIPEGWFKESLLMDFSNQAGHKWWFDKRRYLLDIGVDGFKTDGGEFVFGRALKFADGRSGAQMRNPYPNDYVEGYYKFITDYKHGDGLTFSRAGFTGAQKFPAHWAGDERSTFEAFRHSLVSGLTSGISGIPFWGWDLAGFNGDIPTAELFVRSAQMAAFCPIMQYHAESKGQYNQDRTPWNIAERTGEPAALEGYRYYANVRMNLLPYVFGEAQKASLTGIPLMRALFLEYPDDQDCRTIYDQYLFGDSLHVAPVIEEGANGRDVYFPEGTWINFWSGDIITGPAWQYVNASLMDIPVYVRLGSAVLLNCDESLRLGSWVGNDIEKFKTPVLRLYLEDGMKGSFKDHLEQEWTISANLGEGIWDLKLEAGTDGVVVLIPRSLVAVGSSFSINGRVYSPTENDVLDDLYVLPI